MFELKNYRWYGLGISPTRPELRTCGPTYVTEVRPLKNGKNRLELSILSPLQRSNAVAIRGTFEVISRTESLLAVRTEFANDVCRIGDIFVFEALTDICLRTHSAEFYEKFMPKFIAVDDALIARTILGVFGDTEEEIQFGSKAEGIPPSWPDLPAEVEVVPLRVQYVGLDATIMRRGLRSGGMSNPWFVYSDGSKLLIRRVFSGFIIFSISMHEIDGSLYFTDVSINRDLSQYSSRDIVSDISRLSGILNSVIFREDRYVMRNGIIVREIHS